MLVQPSVWSEVGPRFPSPMMSSTTDPLRRGFTLWRSDRFSLFAGCLSPRQGRLSPHLARLLLPLGRGWGAMGLCWCRVPHPWGVAVPDSGRVPAAHRAVQRGDGDHCWGFCTAGMKGIFLFLMTLLTIYLLPILFTIPSRLLLPFLITASISSSANSSIFFTFPSLSWDHFCSEKEKEGSGAGSKAWRKGSHWGL